MNYKPKYILDYQKANVKAKRYDTEIILEK